MNTNYPKQHTKTLNGRKIRLSGAKKIKSLLEQIGLGDIGIVNNIGQRLQDIELQRWLSEINNNTRKDTNQGNKMKNLPVIQNDRQLQM